MKRRSKHVQKKRFYSIIFIIILFLLFRYTDVKTILEQALVSNVSTELSVHFIDVGQGDCILLKTQDNTMLIDAGNKGDFPVIQDYLASQNVTKLDYLVLTHPHEDHIGSAANIVKNYKIGAVYMTDFSADTKTYRSLLKALKKKHYTYEIPAVGESISLGEAILTFVGPVSSYDNANSMSLVIRAVFGSNSFLFTGDAEMDSEKDMINQNLNLESQVLKVGHHGSSTSSCYVFLKEVNPKYAVISCGTDNDYGHPHEESMSRLNDVGASVFRTDKMGTIVAVCDGKEIRWNQNGMESTQEHVEDIVLDWIKKGTNEFKKITGIE
ncbi:ComEC/Rec2 family competence protein [Anaeromicropila populeti]|uniref:Competence protein ComEC n=1 Tax=Anaeromicropila populeti TaxID=37658 RepID=A0A1I6I5L5_9FIRM|nr:MBL fold metallo-hydrolase [Anaeromicropila populeti]SFR61928.1 competence protein ComEC [Anaeromicropila populeti]